MSKKESKEPKKVTKKLLSFGSFDIGVYNIEVNVCIGRVGIEECIGRGFSGVGIDSVDDVSFNEGTMKALTVCGWSKESGLASVMLCLPSSGVVDTGTMSHEGIHIISYIKELRNLVWGEVGCDEHIAYLEGYIVRSIERVLKGLRDGK